jgi:hypothetical protein
MSIQKIKHIANLYALFAVARMYTLLRKNDSSSFYPR